MTGPGDHDDDPVAPTGDDPAARGPDREEGDEPSDGPADPFDGLTFDDDWVAASTMVEPSARMRANRTTFTELDVLALEEQAFEARRGRHRRRNRRLAALVLVALLAPLVVTLVRDRIDRGGSTIPTSGPPIQVTADADDAPPPQEATSDEPLGEPPEVDPDIRHQFLEARPDGEPVAWDPCRPVRLVVNDAAVPDGGDGLLEDAVAEIADATGLQIEIEGPTDEAPASDRNAYQPDRYGERWAPVLVAWTDPDAMPQLGGDVAGIAGPTGFARPGQPQTWMSGLVLLDGPQLGELIDDGQTGQALGVVVHELAHLIGLAHSDDPTQLMFPEGGPGHLELADGDRAGLARLGQGPCVDVL